VNEDGGQRARKTECSKDAECSCGCGQNSHGDDERGSVAAVLSGYLRRRCSNNVGGTTTRGETSGKQVFVQAKHERWRQANRACGTLRRFRREIMILEGTPLKISGRPAHDNSKARAKGKSPDLLKFPHRPLEGNGAGSTDD